MVGTAVIIAATLGIAVHQEHTHPDSLSHTHMHTHTQTHTLMYI